MNECFQWVIIMVAAEVYDTTIYFYNIKSLNSLTKPMVQVTISVLLGTLNIYHTEKAWFICLTVSLLSGKDREMGSFYCHY